MWVYCEFPWDIGVRIRKEGAEAVILCPGPGLHPLVWGGRQPGGTPSVNHNICRFAFSKGNPDTPRPISPAYSFLKPATTLDNRRVHYWALNITRTDDSRRFSVFRCRLQKYLGDLDKYEPVMPPPGKGINFRPIVARLYLKLIMILVQWGITV